MNMTHEVMFAFPDPGSWPESPTMAAGIYYPAPDPGGCVVWKSGNVQELIRFEGLCG